MRRSTRNASNLLWVLGLNILSLTLPPPLLAKAQFNKPELINQIFVTTEEAPEYSQDDRRVFFVTIRNNTDSPVFLEQLELQFPDLWQSPVPLKGEALKNFVNTRDKQLETEKKTKETIASLPKYLLQIASVALGVFAGFLPRWNDTKASNGIPALSSLDPKLTQGSPIKELSSQMESVPTGSDETIRVDAKSTLVTWKVFPMTSRQTFRKAEILLKERDNPPLKLTVRL